MNLPKSDGGESKVANVRVVAETKLPPNVRVAGADIPVIRMEVRYVG